MAAAARLPAWRRGARAAAALLLLAYIAGSSGAAWTAAARQPAARRPTAAPRQQLCRVGPRSAAAQGQVLEVEAPAWEEFDGEAPVIHVCMGPSCKEDGGAACVKMLQALAPEGVEVRETTCLGPCGSGPNILASPVPKSGAFGGQQKAANKARKATGEAVLQPEGFAFTGMKTEEDAALLAPWGFEVAGGAGPLTMLKAAFRATQLDQVPWPILLYVGFNVIRLVVSLLFHVDILQAATSAPATYVYIYIYTYMLCVYIYI